jgi:hypothetical protein
VTIRYLRSSTVAFAAVCFLACPRADAADAVDAPPLDTAAETAAAAIEAPAAQLAPALNSEADAMLLCELFLDRVVAGNYKEAFTEIRPYFPVSPSRIDKIESETTEQLGMAELQFGRALDHSFISGDQVRGAVLRFRFLQRFDRDAIFWEFVFYKPQDVWLINALGFDDEIRDLFK